MTHRESLLVETQFETSGWCTNRTLGYLSTRIENSNTWLADKGASESLLTPLSLRTFGPMKADTLRIFPSASVSRVTTQLVDINRRGEQFATLAL